MRITEVNTYFLSCPLPQPVRTSTHTIRQIREVIVELQTDAGRVRAVRETAGDGVDIMLDANQGWDLPTAVRAARWFEPYGIFWLEDPMPWYDERQTLRRLKAATSIPIAAGETEYTPFGLRTLLAEGLVDYLIVDSTWAGGLTTWRKAATLAEMYQIPRRRTTTRRFTCTPRQPAPRASSWNRSPTRPAIRCGSSCSANGRRSWMAS